LETFLKTGKPGGNSMETMSLKVLAEKVLERNRQGNIMETHSFHAGKPEGVKVSKVSGMETDPETDRMLTEEQIEEEIAELRPCRVCGENAWWQSTYGRVICDVCHPPASPALVKKWIGDPETLTRLKATRPAVILSWEELRRRKATMEGNRTHAEKRG
jgi:hypothetical protein